MFIGGDSKNVRILLDDGPCREVPLAKPSRWSSPPGSQRRPRRRRPPSLSRSTKTRGVRTEAGPRAPAGCRCPRGHTVNVRLAQAIDVDVSQAGHGSRQSSTTR